MIIGIGVDLCRVERIRRSIAKFGKDWLDEIFIPYEQQQLRSAASLVHRAATGFAIKEACAKALGTGFKGGVRRHDFIVQFTDNSCSVTLTGCAERHAAELCHDLAKCQLYADYRSGEDWASAFAVLFQE